MRRNPTRRDGRQVAIGAIPLLLAGWLGATTADAAVYTTGCASATACTLQELFAGGTITAGGQRFASFAVETDPGTVNWNDVVVTGLDDGGLSPGPGLDFAHNGQVITKDTDVLDIEFSYTVTPVITPWQPVTNELEMIASSVSGDARIEVDEALFDPGHTGLGDKTITTDDAFDQNVALDAIGFPPQAVGLIVSNTITVEGEQPGDYAELDAFQQRFGLQVVPEPGVVPVLATGICWLAAMSQSRPRNRRVPVDERRRAQDVPVDVVPSKES